jgi:hypothetical protein
MKVGDDRGQPGEILETAWGRRENVRGPGGVGPAYRGRRLKKVANRQRSLDYVMRQRSTKHAIRLTLAINY